MKNSESQQVQCAYCGRSLICPGTKHRINLVCPECQHELVVVSDKKDRATGWSQISPYFMLSIVLLLGTGTLIPWAKWGSEGSFQWMNGWMETGSLAICKWNAEENQWVTAVESPRSPRVYSLAVLGFAIVAGIHLYAGWYSVKTLLLFAAFTLGIYPIAFLTQFVFFEKYSAIQPEIGLGAFVTLIAAVLSAVLILFQDDASWKCNRNFSQQRYR